MEISGHFFWVVGQTGQEAMGVVLDLQFSAEHFRGEESERASRGGS
jgi:hypothetical protein